MKLLASAFVLGHLVWGVQAAENEAMQTLLIAAQKLEQQTNYSWISTSQSAPGTKTWRQGPTEGKTDKGGLTYITFTLGDNLVCLGFKGTNAAIHWADQWRSGTELQGEYAWIAGRLKSYKLPAQEAEFLVRNSVGLAKDPAGVFAGALNDVAIKWLLSRGRQEFTDLPEMKGSVKFWEQNGELVKYEYNLRGSLVFESEPEKVQMDRTTTVEIQKVGGTQVAVPQEAQEKLK
jgi:hypothetical protein